MKRALILIILMALCLPCFAETLLETREFVVYTTISDSVYVSLTATAYSTDEGNNFDIAGEDVTYGGTGRKIGTWEVSVEGTSATLTFDAAALTSDSNTAYSLPYILTFSYSYADGSNTKTGDISVPSGTSTTTTLTASSTSSFSFTNQDICFVFSSSFDASDFPTGTYSATVTVTITDD